MAIYEFGIHIPVFQGMEEEHASHLEICARQVANPFFQHHRGEPDFTLKIIFSVESYTGKVLGPVAGRLREYFGLQVECSIVLDFESERESNSI
jgi:hypothetical protein